LIEFIRVSISRPGIPLLRDASNETILTILFTSNMIGTLFARSLHYQFYSWTAWTMPFMLWRTGWNPIIQMMIWTLGEWAWNVYPSTSASSVTVVGVYAAVLVGVWWNWGEELEKGVQREAQDEGQTLKAD
jgi:alpha-1,3-mannosyltransferase